MTDENTTARGQAGAPALPLETRLSMERTMLSHERTLMSWVRTSTSLITFGFTLYKFFELEMGSRPRPPVEQRIGARQFAMIMIGVGLFGLLLAAVQNWQHRKHLRAIGMDAPYSFTTLAALMIGALGVLAMLSTIFRW
jgi:inner membrane protein YidH